MTKNELDAVIRILENAAEAAYMRGWVDGATGTEQRDPAIFKMGPGAILLLQRELRKR